MAVIKKIDSGQSCRDLARELCCGKTQIARIKSERSAIEKEWEAGARITTKYVKRRKTNYEDLKVAVWEWFCQARTFKG